MDKKWWERLNNCVLFLFILSLYCYRIFVWGLLNILIFWNCLNAEMAHSSLKRLSDETNFSRSTSLEIRIWILMNQIPERWLYVVHSPTLYPIIDSDPSLITLYRFVKLCDLSFCFSFIISHFSGRRLLYLKL